LEAGLLSSPRYDRLSDSSLIQIAVSAIQELLDRQIAGQQLGHNPESVLVPVSSEFSRGDIKHFDLILRLWHDWGRQSDFAVHERVCPACANTESNRIFSSYDGYDYHTCSRCSTWFVPWQVTGQVQETFLDEVPEARQATRDLVKARADDGFEVDSQRFNGYLDLFETLSRARVAPSYLDVGCGVGHALSVARNRGWKSTGVEIDETSAQVARETGHVVVGDLLELEEARFDFISLFETLEHLNSVDAVMKSLSQKLSEDGLMMITVPNRASFDIAGLRERSLHVFGGASEVGHINLFDESSLAILLGRHGLAPIYADSHFGVNLLRLVSHFTGASVDPSAMKEVELEPTVAMLLNNLGPIFSAVERLAKRSPILIVVACRAESHFKFDKAARDADEKRLDSLSLHTAEKR
jgi:2-polyprenyl-3-methyl-5-hydroxy-6-metoxy-1,4-benzoquinol methylase